MMEKLDYLNIGDFLEEKNFFLVVFYLFLLFIDSFWMKFCVDIKALSCQYIKLVLLFFVVFNFQPKFFLDIS